MHTCDITSRDCCRNQQEQQQQQLHQQQRDITGLRHRQLLMESISADSIRDNLRYM